MVEIEPAIGQHQVGGFEASPRTVAVWGADVSREAPGWRLAGVDLGMRDGRPFGSLRFESVQDSRSPQVAVRWDHIYDQLHCFVTDRNFGAERECLERDARHRVGTLMAAYAQVGLSIAAAPVAEGALRAAANLIPVESIRPR